MPTEMRRIVFSNEELQNAINFFNSPNIPKLLDGRIVSASISQDDNKNIRLRYASYNRDEERIIDIATANVGAILVNYCIKNKIPMSKKAGKAVKIIGDNVSLELTFGPAQIAL